MPPKTLKTPRGKSATPSIPPTSEPSRKWHLLLLVGGILGGLGAYFASQLMTKSDTPTITQFATSTPTVSIIMIAHNENHYLERTFDSIMNNSPLEHLLEIIFVDDASDPPASTVLDKMNNPRINLIRNEERQGLIRAKTVGARAAQGDILVFLDAHVRTYPEWMEPMIRLTGENYKRVVVPTIPVLNGTTWEQIKNYVGIKLIFDWKMDFIWYVDDDDDYVPIMSGGLLAITRKWFFETGGYDTGMLQWGGENVEQSVKIWLCGGEIVVARSSRVGHVFRDDSPYVINTTQIHVNKARAIDVWFDEWASYYYRANPFDRERRSTTESLAPQFEIKEKLDCKPFSTFVEKFRKVMLRENLLPVEVFGLRHKETGLCVELQPTGDLKGVTCDEEDRGQVFIPDSWNRLRSGKFTEDCWEQQVPFKVGLCTAHEPNQQDWSIDASGEIMRKSESGQTKCVQMDNEGNMSMGKCTKSHLFEKVHIAPYSHDLYK